MREILRSLSKKVVTLNSNINGKYALTVDRKDIELCFGDEKSKSLNIAVQCLYGVFSKSSLLTCDSFR